MAATSLPPPPASGIRHLRKAPDVHRLNLAWLIRLRWVAIIGQTTVIVGSIFLPGVEFAYLILATILLVEVLSNLGLIAWARTGKPRHEAVGAVVLMADILFLTLLLYFTGGASNPFGLLYLVHVALAALVLRALWTWVVTLLSVVAFIGLHAIPSPGATLPWSGSGELWTIQTQGSWAAFVVTAAVIAFFVNMIQRALTRRDEELIRVRDAQMRSEKLASLATLAAGAAHEFSTPLSTIALVATELRRGLEKQEMPHQFIDDAELIRDQVERCREILQQMSADAGESMGEIARPVVLRELIDHTLDGCRDRDRVEVTIESERSASLTVPTTALGQALRGLINNGLEASSPEEVVEFIARDEGDDVVLIINDHGTGMCPAVLERVGEPFFTTKETGEGMGLGVFLARTLVEKIGGEVAIASALGQGTRVEIRLPGIAEEASTLAATASATIPTPDVLLSSGDSR